METITGTIDKVIYQDLGSGYVVFVITNYDRPPITVKGKLPPLQPGQEVELSGLWILDPKYGKQFEAESCITKIPCTITGLKKFLGSGLIKGIGAVYAEKLVTYFGENVLTIIDKEPERLRELGGIGPKRRELIIAGWKEHQEIAHIMVFLQDKGISPALGARIYKKYHHATLPTIQQNPYRLAEEVWGIGFKTADEVAQKLGFQRDSPHRITAGVLFALTSAMQQGHLYLEVQDLKNKTLELLELSNHEEHQALIKKALHTLYEHEKVKLVREENLHFLGLSKSYRAEQEISKILTTLVTTPSSLSVPLHQAYETLRVAQDPALTDSQIEGIMTAFQKKVSIITGGPGTGKTTLVKKLLSVLDEYKIPYKLAAPTGKAAKRMTESTGRPAATVHRLLEFDPITFSFKHGPHNALPVQMLIIDEASMIDVFLAQAILKALPHTAHVLFMGDSDQLPPVGAGNFLQDMITSQKISLTRLNQVFRQAQDSLIIVNAHRINRGDFPTTFLPDTRKDFMFLKEESVEEISRHLKRVLFSELPQHNILPSQAVVLTPMNRGGAGTHALNTYLQSLLNGGTVPHIMFGGTLFKQGDRVMQMRNNYDKFIFNGDTGFIEEISPEDKIMTVVFTEKKVIYEFSELHELVLAYAVTIHKSQGSEYPAVIVPLFTQHFTLLQRNLLYTGITRAKKLCVVIGQPKAIAIAIRTTKGTERVTFLKKFLDESLCAFSQQQ